MTAPDTQMAHAFLRALLVWAARRCHGAGLIALPSGRVDADELKQCVVALCCARGGGGEA